MALPAVIPVVAPAVVAAAPHIVSAIAAHWTINTISQVVGGRQITYEAEVQEQLAIIANRLQFIENALRRSGDLASLGDVIDEKEGQLNSLELQINALGHREGTEYSESWTANTQE